jgi:Tol biopolymer transport system component
MSQPRALTHVRGWDMAARISPAGDRIAFLRFEGEHIATYVAPLDGHAPPHEIAKGTARPSWSRDGKGVWTGDGTTLNLIDPDTLATLRTIPGVPGAIDANTIELPGGALVSQVGDAGGVHAGGLALLAEGSPLKWLVRGDLDEVLALSADGRHVITSRATNANQDELIDVPLDGSPVSSLSSTGIVAHKGFAISRDGKRVAWSTCRSMPRLVTVDAKGRFQSPAALDAVDAVQIGTVPGTSELAVISNRTGPAMPWLVDATGKTPPRAIPVGDLVPRDVAVSSDASRFTFSVAAKGIYLGSVRGDPALRPLTTEPGDSDPCFRHGDAEVLFTRHVGDGRPQVSTIPVAGGDAKPLLDVGTDDAAASPVEDVVAYLLGPSSQSVPMVWDARTGRSRPLSAKLVNGRYWGLHFSLDGKRVAFVRGDTDLLEVDLATGEVLRTVSTPTADALYTPTYTSVGLLVVRVGWQGNLWVADATF